MKYSIESFGRCYYNPMKGLLGGSSMMDLYVDLRDRPGFLVKSLGVGINKDLVIRWILSLYQPESPLIVDFPDYRLRKVKAGMLFGFETEGGDITKFTSEYSQVILGRNERVNRLILEFCRMMRAEDYTELRIYQDKLYDAFSRLQNLTDSKHEKVLLENISTFKERIAHLRSRLVVHDEDKGLEVELTSMLDYDYVDMSREAIAKRLQLGQDIYGEDFRPPYGSDYVKQYYKDINRERFHGKN